MITTNYYDTFISVADDCPVSVSEVPPLKDPKSIAQIEYEMVKDNPYKYTSDDVLYAANGERRGISQEEFLAKDNLVFGLLHVQSDMVGVFIATMRVKSPFTQ